jgi:hypothetical protein
LTSNVNLRKQLSLDNFFVRPSKKGKEKETGYPTPTASSLRATSSSEKEEDNNFEDDDAAFIDDSDLDDPRPKKKLKYATIPEKKTRRPAVARKTSSTARSRLGGARGGADQSDLPPLSDIPKMFDDLVSRANGLDKVIDRLNGRKLRVATMCSGTESPLLALRMITRSLEKELGKKFDVEHIFSCEIEPFKQAYIERNFAPPILFRDVLELEHDYAYLPP